MTLPRCAIGLLTWNGERDVVRCVQSILAQTEPNLEILWMDNASEDATVKSVQEFFPNFPAPVMNPSNLGFCAGHNRLFDSTTTPYYLALNQDAVLAPDYVQKLCDWMEEDTSLALTSGLILQANSELDPSAKIYSAGMAMGRGRFPFELRMGMEPRSEDRQQRYVPAVTGAAMMIRRSAISTLSESPGQLFPPEFFAYFEEVDLALRAIQAGMRCGVAGSALAWHSARGQGGEGNALIRMHYLKNHWLVSLRNDGWSDFIRELPYILKGEMVHYLPKYLSSPKTTIKALNFAFGHFRHARKSFASFSQKFPDARQGRAEFYKLSLQSLKKSD